MGGLARLTSIVGEDTFRLLVGTRLIYIEGQRVGLITNNIGSVVSLCGLTDEKNNRSVDFISMANTLKRANENGDIYFSNGTFQNSPSNNTLIDNFNFVNANGFTISKLIQYSTFISNEKLEIYAVKLSATTVLSSLLVTAYRMLGIGGRQKALAIAVPPGFIDLAAGRKGLRVPSHPDYDISDVKQLAKQISRASDSELNEILSKTDPELIPIFESCV